MITGFDLNIWLTVFPIFGIFGAIAGIFGSNAQKQAAQNALRLINEARELGTKEAKAVSAIFDPWITTGKEQLGTSFDIMQRLVGIAETGATTPGLTSQDQLAFEDAQRLINENLVATGNLRSGAGAFASAELGRRVTADAAQRRQNYLQLALSGGGQLGGIAQATGQIGLGGKQLSGTLLQAAMGLAPAAASAQLQIGAAQAAQYQAYGGLADAGLGAALGGFGGIGGLSGWSGAAAGSGLGTGGIGQLAMLQSIFGKGGGGGGGSQLPLLPGDPY